MKISTKGRYGLMALVDLGAHSNGSHISLCSIAQRQDISENYLLQMFSELRKAGIVNSVKGAQGGYVLADSPTNMTIGHILRVLEGNLSVISEETLEDDALKSNLINCLKKFVWNELNERINSFLDSVSLEEIINEYKKMSGNENDMFYI